MQGNKWLVSLLSLAVGLAAGCTSRITNLTPSALPREAGGLYRFEVEWASTQRSLHLRSDSVKGYIVVDQAFHPMQRVPGMSNRWEGDVLLPEGKNPVFYFYKWDYGTAGFGRDLPNSARSQQYRLEIVEEAR